MSDRRYSRPILLEKGSLNVQPLQRIGYEQGEGSFSEDWLQDLLFKQPSLLPIEQIEPAFSDAVPVCRELPTPAGSVDLVLVTEDGLPVIVETKLWRSPDARRTVIAQLLDYAKETAAWTAEQFDTAVKQARDDRRTSFDVLSDALDEPDEAGFYDGLSRNLRDGRFLLLIVGDGIREGVESMTRYLQSHVGLRLTFGLVELGVYRVPALPALEETLLVQPQVLAKTVGIERAVIRRETTGILVDDPEEGAETRPERFTEEIFFDKLAGVDENLPSRLRLFFHACEDRLCDSAKERGDLSIGTHYLETLAGWCKGCSVRKKGNPWTWRIVKKDGKIPPMGPFLDHAEEWLELIDNSMNRFRKSRKMVGSRSVGEARAGTGCGPG